MKATGSLIGTVLAVGLIMFGVLGWHNHTRTLVHTTTQTQTVTTGPTTTVVRTVTQAGGQRIAPDALGTKKGLSGVANRRCAQNSGVQQILVDGTGKWYEIDVVCRDGVSINLVDGSHDNYGIGR